MDASIEVLSTSHVSLINQCNNTQPSLLQIHARIRVLPKASDASPFDSATFTLYGAVKTEIGSKFALREIFEISDDKSWLEFEPCYKESAESYVDVTFDILPKDDASDKSSSQSFVPSLSLSGQTTVTTSDVLTSQQIIKGQCDVFYWIEAEFWHHRQVVHRMKVNVHVSKSTAPIQMQVTAATPAELLTTPVKPQKRAMLRRGWPLKLKKYLTPKISVHVPNDLGMVYAATTKSYTDYQLIAVPLTFLLETPPADEPKLTDMMGRFLGTASVEAKWYTTKTFSTANIAAQNPDKNNSLTPRITTRSVVTQKQHLSFPPFYQERAFQTLAGEDHTSRYSATAIFEILLPDTIRCPTVDTELLKVAYDLELKISMEGNNTAAEKDLGIVPCAAKLRFPVRVETM
ncbi:uncharacterized protein AB675_11853 [Cyphellophora attinorum]|uniref:Arrestin-like N-terminal domain-containing protein n=1 Tax=Cyphellophora attinorum TaxID=1664694 RepID=A0A0N1HNT1_9EURO|nr:uncharacterized protein AB675_11853 [Phialophora attinorum]KPI36774.1 hypothetical protein AB675_11853 [Phialophora attinorum]